MLHALIDALKSIASNDAVATQRRHPRRTTDRCVVVVYGRTFPVENWSFSGLLLQGDDRLFGQGLEVEFTLKFRVRNAILDLNHRGRVIRRGNGKIAVQFEPLTQTVRHGFQRVVDDAAAREFAESQA